MSPVPSEGGVLPVDKPVGPTSHDVVARARRVLNTRRIGHTGTLDPFASGLLLLCVGPATRLSEYLTSLPKEYVATARLGIATDTHDVEGRVLEEREVPDALDPGLLQEALEALSGDILQRPPSYSAKKVAGEAAHRRVRRGEAVELEPVPVTVHELELLSRDGPELRLRIRCSSGTYIRALARDLGEIVGTGAHLTGLRRTRIGAFDVADAVPDELSEASVADAWIEPARAVSHLPRVAVDPEGARRLASGQAIAVPGEPSAAEPLSSGAQGPPEVVVVVREEELVAVAERNGGMLRPRKVFVQG